MEDQLYDKLSEAFDIYRENHSYGEGDLKEDIRKDFITKCFHFLDLA